MRRAAFIALGRTASDLTPDERLQAAGVLRAALRRVRDPLTRGLADIAIGRLVAAHLADGAPLAPDLRALWRQLLADARSGSATARGFGAIGVGLAARTASAAEARTPWQKVTRAEAEKVLLQGLQAPGGDSNLRGAHAIALGIMRARDAVPVLAGCVEDRTEDARLRADAATALGLVCQRHPDALRALHLALAEGRRPRVRTGAALGLSLLQGPSAGSRLLRDLARAGTTEDVIRLTEPLGYLGDPALAKPLVTFADSPRNADFPRALMFVALGNIGDPEPRPSLAVLGQDANYPTAPPTLRDALYTR